MRVCAGTFETNGDARGARVVAVNAGGAFRQFMTTSRSPSLSRRPAPGRARCRPRWPQTALRSSKVDRGGCGTRQSPRRGSLARLFSRVSASSSHEKNDFRHCVHVLYVGLLPGQRAGLPNRRDPRREKRRSTQSVAATPASWAISAKVPSPRARSELRVTSGGSCRPWWVTVPASVSGLCHARKWRGSTCRHENVIEAIAADPPHPRPWKTG